MGQHGFICRGRGPRQAPARAARGSEERPRGAFGAVRAHVHALQCMRWGLLSVAVLVVVHFPAWCRARAAGAGALEGGGGMRTLVTDQRFARAIGARFPSFRRKILGDAGQGAGARGGGGGPHGDGSGDEGEGSRDAAGGAETAYMVMVDAGSSGSRAHVFKLKWKTAGARAGVGELPDVQLPSKKLKIEPGLSSYEHSPGAAGESLLKLIEFAKRHVPPEHWSSTPFIVAATAGLRLLPPSTGGQQRSECPARAPGEGRAHAHAD